MADLHPRKDVRDRPEDSPIAWFAELLLALEREDFGRAAEARHELDRLGWSVSRRKRPKTAAGRGVAR